MAGKEGLLDIDINQLDLVSDELLTTVTIDASVNLSDGRAIEALFYPYLLAPTSLDLIFTSDQKFKS